MKARGWRQRGGDGKGAYIHARDGGGRDDVSTPANLVFDTQRLGFFGFCCPEGGGIGSGVGYLEGEVGSGRAGPSGGCQGGLVSGAGAARYSPPSFFWRYLGISKRLIPLSSG